MRPDAAVFSFPRSGTHWFCSLLKRWFYGDVDISGLIDVGRGLEWRGGTRDDVRARESGMPLAPWAGLIGGHFYDPESSGVQQELLRERERKAIYLWRDGKDVMVSTWRMASRSNEEMGIPVVSFSDYLNAHHDPSAFPGENPAPDVGGRVLTTPLLWWWSTLRWAMEGNVLLIRYDELCMAPEMTCERVARYLGRERPGEMGDVTSPVGMEPSNKPRSGRWKDHFSREDIELWERERDVALSLLEEYS